MNALCAYLERNSERLPLEWPTGGHRWSCLIKTPRFRASRHVIFLLYRERESQPSLVAKVARLPDDEEGIAREATNLREVQPLYVTESDSIPRLVAHDDLDGYPFLIETAVRGEPIGPQRVARNADHWCRAMLDWLRPLDGSPTNPPTSWNCASWQRSVVQPLDRCRRLLPWPQQDSNIERSLQRLAASLEQPPFGHIFEHGDLSHPNLIEYQPGKVGVIDWELAEAAGVPLHDFVFFLIYVTLSSVSGATSDKQQRALAAAFQSRDGWAWKWIHRYLDERSVPRDFAQDLVLLAVLRYLDTTMSRLKAETNELAEQSLPPQLHEWLQQNRYFQFAQWLLASMPVGRDDA